MIVTNYIKALPSSPSNEWVRPSDWLPMPTVTSSDDTFVGLHAIFSGGNNFVAFLFTTSTGDYQVDWGDGTVSAYTSNTKAEHTYDYTTYDPTNTTLTTRGYKQAMITVTAVSGLLRTCNFQQRVTTTPAQNQPYSTGFLDCTLSMPNANTGASITFGGNASISHRYVERVDIKTIGLTTNLTLLFFNCGGLQSIPLFDTSNVTNMSNMFSNCLSLHSVPLFNTSNVTNMSGMFQNCQSLQLVPLFDTSNVTNMSTIFSTCVSLQSVPLFNTSNVTNMSGMIQSCTSLQSVPLFDTSNVTNMSVMINGCSALQTVPLFNTSNVINMANMFQSCVSLQSVPSFDTSNVTNMSVMFNSCTSLKLIPPLSTVKITTTSGTDFGNFTNGSLTLSKIGISFARSVNLSNCQLSRDALVEIFNNLVNRSSTTTATITITGNWGAQAGGLSAADRLIATNKNWTITG